MELALRIQARKHAKEKYTDVRPRGSIIVGLTESQIRKKWVEIVCNLMSPAKRAMFNKFRYYNDLIPLWQQSWHDAYISAERGETTHDAVWELVSGSGDIETSVGNEPGGRVNATLAWDWSDSERKIYMLIKMDETTWSGKTPLKNLHMRVTKVRNKDKKRFIISENRIDWDTDIGISPKTVAEIEDISKVVQPHLLRKRNFSVLKTNKILEI